jgi:hypothetical protein
MKKEEDSFLSTFTNATNRPLSISTKESVTDVIRRLTRKSIDLSLKGLLEFA